MSKLFIEEPSFLNKLSAFLGKRIVKLAFLECIWAFFGLLIFPSKLTFINNNIVEWNYTLYGYLIVIYFLGAFLLLLEQLYFQYRNSQKAKHQKKEVSC